MIERNLLVGPVHIALFVHDQFPEVRVEYIDVTRVTVAVHYNSGCVEFDPREADVSQSGGVVQVATLLRLHTQPDFVIDVLRSHYEIWLNSTITTIPIDPLEHVHIERAASGVDIPLPPGISGLVDLTIRACRGNRVGQRQNCLCALVSIKSLTKRAAKGFGSVLHLGFNNGEDLLVALDFKLGRAVESNIYVSFVIVRYLNLTSVYYYTARTISSLSGWALVSGLLVCGSSPVSL